VKRISVVFVLFVCAFLFWGGRVDADPIDDLRSMQIDLENMVAASLGELDQITADRIVDLQELITVTLLEFDRVSENRIDQAADEINVLKESILREAEGLVAQGEVLFRELISEIRCQVSIIKTTAIEFSLLGNSNLEEILKTEEEATFSRLNATRWLDWDQPRLSPQEIMEAYYSLARLTNAVVCEAALTDRNVADFYLTKYREYAGKASLWAWALNTRGK
jgi:hypothetical protein